MNLNTPIVGIIANPVSARDIRRIVAHGSNMQITERANIVLRLLAGLAAAGVEQVVIMPEKAGIRHHVDRGLRRSRKLAEGRFPEVGYLDMPITATAQDSVVAARLMNDLGVSAMIVLGGDGTHRAVVSARTSIPVAGVSTGTNNAFPKFQEPTTVGIAVGLAVTDPALGDVAFKPNKILEIDVGGQREIALVDVAVVAERFIGARALWRAQNFKALYVTFAETGVIGMSAIAGLLDPVSRDDPQGRCVLFDASDRPDYLLRAPIAPGVIESIGIDSWQALDPDIAYPIAEHQGSIALDGERELSFGKQDQPTITLRTNAFRTVDIAACMKFGAQMRLLQDNRINRHPQTIKNQ